MIAFAQKQACLLQTELLRSQTCKKERERENIALDKKIINI